MKIVASVNQKGGVGKTTFAAQTAYRLADCGKRVLIIDFDPQRNSSMYWLDDYTNLPTSASSANLFHESATINPIPAASVQIGSKLFYENQIDILYADTDELTLLEQSSDNQLTIAYGLSQFERVKTMDYDYVIIDCPPAICMKQILAVLVADAVVTPMELDGFSAEGILKIHEIIEAAKGHNESVGVLDKPNWHIIANKVGLQSASSVSMLAKVREELGSILLDNFISYSTVINDAVLNRRPIFKLPPNGNAAAVGRKYAKALDELLDRIGR
ncbi:ParA family protein [Vibrio vulnificus]